MSKTIADMIPQRVDYYPGGRAEYASRTGQQAPPFDPSRPPRLWTPGYPAYRYLAPGGLKDAPAASGDWDPMPLVNAFLGMQTATSVNMPGKYRFVNWAAWCLTRPSSAVTAKVPLFDSERTVALPAEALFLPKEASAIAFEIGQGAKAVEAHDWNGQPCVYFYPADENRRVWSIQIGSRLLALSALFRQRTDGADMGIGSTGTWMVDDAAVTWKNIPVDDGGNRTDFVPPPSVALGPDEEVAMEAVSGMVRLVVRTKGSSAPPATPVPAGGLTAAQDAKLQDLWAGMKLLLSTPGK